MFQAEKKLADTQMHSLIAIMTTSKPMGVPEGINTKIHTSRDFGSRGRRVTLPRKKVTGKATLANRIWLPQKITIEYSVIDHKRCTVPGQGEPNLL